MIVISLATIEKLIFLDKKIRQKLPYTNEYSQWEFSKIHVGFKQMGMKAILTVLNSLNESDLIILKNYFEDDVKIDKTTTNLVENYSDHIDCLEFLLNDKCFSNFVVYRNENNLDLTFWR